MTSLCVSIATKDLSLIEIIMVSRGWPEDIYTTLLLLNQPLLSSYCLITYPKGSGEMLNYRPNLNGSVLAYRHRGFAHHIPRCHI